MTIYEEFFFWITSMVEDTPVPYEIKYLYFIVNFQNNCCILSFAGCERDENPLLNFEYYPLDAYHFANHSYMEIKDIYLAKITAKELIEQALETYEFKKIFKNKKIFLCQLFGEVEYMFEV